LAELIKVVVECYTSVLLRRSFHDKEKNECISLTILDWSKHGKSLTGTSTYSVDGKPDREKNLEKLVKLFY
jgi:hypothetical protein